MTYTALALLEELVNRFPGLMDHDLEIDGPELTQDLTALITKLCPRDRQSLSDAATPWEPRMTEGTESMVRQ